MSIEKTSDNTRTPDATDLEHDSVQQSDPNDKAKRYFGLLVVLVFFIVMHLQLDFRQLGDRVGFFQKTFTNALVWSEGRGNFVRNYETSLGACEYARRGVASSSFQNSLNRMREACSAVGVTYYSVDSLDRIQTFDTEYETNIKKYFALRQQAQKEGVDLYSYPQTAELIEKLSASVNREYLNAQTWLSRMNIAAHGIVIFLAYLGIWYRRGLGHLASAPLRWVTSAGKGGIKAAQDIHKKI